MTFLDFGFSIYMIFVITSAILRPGNCTPKSAYINEQIEQLFKPLVYPVLIRALQQNPNIAKRKMGTTQIWTSNGHISETKRGILDPLVPKFFSRRGLSSTLSWKWANVTLSPSFGLFQSEKPLFRGVPDVTHCHSLARICPQVPFPRGKKKIYMAPHTLAGRVKFMSSFVLALSVFTQPVWKRMYLGF